MKENGLCEKFQWSIRSVNNYALRVQPVTLIYRSSNISVKNSISPFRMYAQEIMTHFEGQPHMAVYRLSNICDKSMKSTNKMLRPPFGPK
jgi:hypothetical protein